MKRYVFREGKYEKVPDILIDYADGVRRFAKQFIIRLQRRYNKYHRWRNDPFTTLEAESGMLGGGANTRSFVLGSAVPAAATLELEASGGALVELNATGQSISWVNPVANANSIVIRASIPDTPDGTGMNATLNLYVDGKFRQLLTLSSKQSWIYPQSKTNPRDPNGGGSPYHFYNENRAFIGGAPIPPGSKITLQKDGENIAAAYDIDCIDLENVPPPLTLPLKT